MTINLPSLTLIDGQVLDGSPIDLGVLDPAFENWRLWRGQLISPEKWHFDTGDLYSLPFLHQLIAEQARELRNAIQYDLFKEAL